MVSKGINWCTFVIEQHWSIVYVKAGLWLAAIAESIWRLWETIHASTSLTRCLSCFNPTAIVSWCRYLPCSRDGCWRSRWMNLLPGRSWDCLPPTRSQWSVSQVPWVYADAAIEGRDTLSGSDTIPRIQESVGLLVQVNTTLRRNGVRGRRYLTSPKGV